jgi:hypothetical protein
MNSTLSTSAQFFPRLVILGLDDLGVEDFLVEDDAKNCPLHGEGARGSEEEAARIDGRPYVHPMEPRARARMLMRDYFADVHIYRSNLFRVR